MQIRFNAKHVVFRRPWLAGAVGVVAIVALMNVISCQRAMPLRQGWNPSLGPVVPHDKFPADCSICHTGGNWKEVRKDFVFDHEAKTGYALRGAHQNAACLRCHNDRGPVAQFASRGCAGCHTDPHRSRLGQSCEKCHTEQTWSPTGVAAMHNRTRFPLIGAHASVACFACHSGAQVGNFSGTDTACTSCHQADLARTNAPNHIAQGWTINCQTCHTPRSWQVAFFRHTSAFPLTGGHAGLSCTQCHKTTVFFAIDSQCVACHLKDYQNTREPNHVLLGFSTDCAECHTPRAWQGGTTSFKRRK